MGQVEFESKSEVGWLIEVGAEGEVGEGRGEARN